MEFDDFGDLFEDEVLEMEEKDYEKDEIEQGYFYFLQLKYFFLKKKIPKKQKIWKMFGKKQKKTKQKI